jgi:hypothetical protein
MGVANTALQEMLIQSHHLNGNGKKYNLQGGSGIIQVIPAVNDYLAGRFKLHCRGGFTVEAEFQTMKRIVKLSITSTRGGILKIMNPYDICDIRINSTIVREGETGKVIQVSTSPGDVVTVNSAETKKQPR